MTLRARLAWAFSTMLLVPGLLLLVVGGVAELVWMRNDNAGAIAVLNAQVEDNPASLLTDAGFALLERAAPWYVALGIQTDGRWVQTSPGFITTGERHRELVQWRFSLPDGRKALLDVQFQPHSNLPPWAPWFALAPLLGLVVLVLTNGTLTWLVGRSILRPLGQLEAAARRLGDGDLDPAPMPSKPPEFRRVGAAFDEMRVRLKASLQDRERLEEERRVWVASISHDLRTPLTALRGYAEGLRDGMAKTAEKQEKYHSVILERTRQMERLVDDLFQWARWDWGPPPLQPVALDLGDELSAAVTAWKTDWPTLVVHWERPEGSWPVRGDAVALRRVFDNLARNVVQHAGPHPVLHIALHAQGGYEVVFRDEGPGIDPELLPRVFERFFRGDPARNPQWGGGGLGLTIARTLAEASGGTLTADTVEGGAQFRLKVPAS